MNAMRTTEVCAALMLLFPSSDIEATDVAPIHGGAPIMIAQFEKGLMDFLNLREQQNHKEAADAQLTAWIFKRDIQGDWIVRDIGIQAYVDGERLDPQQFMIEWKLSVSHKAANANFVDRIPSAYDQVIHVEVHFRDRMSVSFDLIEVEAKIVDLQNPDKSPDVIRTTLRDLLVNGPED
jgi:hypothetical protein